MSKKILFIENRHKTYLFESIAGRLKLDGYSIHWLVQNHQFSPLNSENRYLIDYPTLNSLKNKTIEGVEEIIKIDRQVNCFKKTNTSYFYYYNEKIEEYLKNLKPDIVFGEATAFHELLTIYNCKKLNILYLNPCTCRYPLGRFSFYLYDTLEPFKGNEVILPHNQAEVVVNQIINRTAVPDYMKTPKLKKWQIVKDQINKIISYIRGERFNTPNPYIKYNLEKEKSKKIKKWNTISVNDIKEENKVKVLYPLHMQPEANIDVWGRKYREQHKLIETIAINLPENAVLYIKPNPKSKYELSEALIETVTSLKNVVPLSHSVKMDDILPKVDLVITVTGTIAIECILSNKPVATLVKTINNKAPNCVFMNDIQSDLKNVIDSVYHNTFVKITKEQKIDFINILNTTSYKGLISDPFTNINCILDENIDDIYTAFKNVI